MIATTRRCDADEAETALVEIQKTFDDGFHGELAFCAHHFDENTYLLALGWEIVNDERSTLDQPLVSANVD